MLQNWTRVKGAATRFAISAAFQRNVPGSADLRVRLTDANGQIHEPNKNSQASGSGSELGVTTLICEFAVAEREIDMLIVERRKRP